MKIIFEKNNVINIEISARDIQKILGTSIYKSKKILDNLSKEDLGDVLISYLSDLLSEIEDQEENNNEKD